MKRQRQHATGPGVINLPAPSARRSRSVLAALRERRTTRAISDRPLSLGILSDLLWAACGCNRRRGPFGLPGRTAASASNSQEVDVYVAQAKGTYRYDPLRHRLVPVIAADLRAFAISRGQSPLGARAPLRLIYVADIDRQEHSQGFDEPGLHDPEIQRAYYFVDTGLIAGNVYLFSAATGLAAWFHNCDRDALATKLGLGPTQRVLFAQTVGYPVRRTRAGRR